jgi:myo-inositol-1(or 4)-monophosphatase
MFLGSKETGLQIVNREDRGLTPQEDIPRVLVSRREHRNGDWKNFESGEFEIRPVGSIAYRLALVGAGRASATCTFEPRSEWDVAAGVALLLAASGEVHMANGSDLLFNQKSPVIQGCHAFAKACPSSIRRQIRSCAASQELLTVKARSL